jgi:ABC-type polysaccharide/polyol phosphate transport system ATPase subunit
MPEEIITVSNVSKVFHQNSESSFGKIAWSYFCEYILNRKNFATDKNNFYALKDIHFSLKKGESMGIIGLNGSGKSTLLQLLAGTMQPTTGKITVKGKVAALLELGSGFNPQFTGKENIYLNAKLHGLAKEQIDRCFGSIVSFANIGNFINFPVRTYSSGMIVRLAFSIIAHVKADLLIIDEALAVGDARFQAKCFSFLESFKEKGKSLLFVSHDVNSIARLCSTAILLNKGKVHSVGSTREVINEYSKTIAAGTHSINDFLESSSKRKAKLLENKQKKELTPDEFNYGGKKAEITSCEIFNDQSIKTTVISSGENFVVRFNVHAKSFVEKPIYGITIRDRKGQQVYGQNTHFSTTPTKSLKKGDETIVEFKLEANLGEGKYLLSFGVTQFMDDDLEVIHRRYDALEFQVINFDGSFGISNCFCEITHNLKREL